MTEENGGARPASDRPAADRNVAPVPAVERDDRIAAYRAERQRAASRDMDRYIARVYGPQHARRWSA